MLQRIFVTVKRGLTDNTAVCIYPWEKPIMQEIHGGSVTEVSIEEMSDLKNPISVKKLKHKNPKTEDAPNLRAQLEAMMKVDPEESPLQDPEGEYGRLVERYGMHLTVAVPNVEKVFGSYPNFRRALADYAKGRLPEFLDVSGPITEGEKKSLAEMSDKEVRAALKKAGVAVEAKASREKLEQLYTDHVAEEATA